MKKFVILTAILMGSILFPSLCPVPKVSEGNLVIIVNKDNPIASISASEAKLYYLRKLKNRWPGINKNIRPVTRNTKCSERDAFYGQILKMKDTEVDTYFAERQFQNAEKAPDKLNSDAEVVDFVSKEVGGIGFVSAGAVSGNVKVVLEF